MRASGQPPSGELPIGHLLAILWARRVAVLSVLCIGLGLGLAALTFLPPRFEAQALILIEPSPLRSSDVLLSDDQRLADSAAIDSQVRVLRSRLLAQDVVAAHDLHEDEAFLIATGGLPQRPATLALAVERLIGGLVVQRDGSTRVIMVRFKSRDPYVSARTANAVADRYVVSQLTRKYETTRSAADFLGSQLERSKAELAAAEAAYDAFREQTSDTLKGTDGVRDIEISRIKGEAVTASAERAALQAELARLRTVMGRDSEDGVFEALGGSLVLQNLFDRKNQALSREAELRSQFGERHPRIVDVRAELREIEARIRQEQQALLGRMEVRVAQARARERTLEEELERIKTQSSAAADVRLQEARLAEAVARKQELFDNLASRFESLVRSDQVQRPDARIISGAMPAERPSFPDPLVFLGLAFTSSLTSGVFFAFLLEGRERGFRWPNELEAALGRPCLGSLPLMAGRRNTPPPWQHVVESPDDAFAETLRGIVAELGVERSPSGAKVLMLTSTHKGEGTAAVTLGLARAAALSGARVLLLEARLRDPRLKRQLGLDPAPGLAEVLIEGCALDQVLVLDRAVVPHLTVLPAGELGDIWPTRLFGPDGLPVMLQDQKSKYDLILVSAAPLLEQAEARALARHTDGVLLVVAFRQTPRNDVEAAVNLLERAGGRLRGSLLNLVDPKAQKRL